MSSRPEPEQRRRPERPRRGWLLAAMVAGVVCVLLGMSRRAGEAPGGETGAGAEAEVVATVSGVPILADELAEALRRAQAGRPPLRARAEITPAFGRRSIPPDAPYPIDVHPRNSWTMPAGARLVRRAPRRPRCYGVIPARALTEKERREILDWLIDTELAVLRADELGVASSDRIIRRRMGGKRPVVRVPDAPTDAPAADGRLKSFFLLGVDHVATGYDHLAFLPALLLAVLGAGRGAGLDASRGGEGQPPRRAQEEAFHAARGLRHALGGVLLSVTAFTLGHSLTLALMTLELLCVDAPSVEILIPLSIAVVSLLALSPRETAGDRWLGRGALLVVCVLPALGGALGPLTTAGLLLFALAYLELAAGQGPRSSTPEGGGRGRRGAETAWLHALVALLFGLALFWLGARLP